MKQKNIKLYDRPVGVTILSILGFVLAGLFILFSLISLFAAPFLATLITDPLLAGLLSAGAIFLTLLFLFLAAIEYFISKGLWDGKEWARIVFIVFSSIAVLGSLADLPGSILSLVFNGFVIWYLGFRPEVKKYFN